MDVDASPEEHAEATRRAHIGTAPVFDRLGSTQHIISLQNDGAGLDEIEGPLIEAIEAAGVGEFEGNDIGADGAVLLMCGPDPGRGRPLVTRSESTTSTGGR